MSQAPPDRAFQNAVQVHLAGRLADAESLYRQILVQNPNHPDALHFLGVIAYQRHQLEDAATLIRRAIALKPDSAVPYSNLGNVLRDLGRPGEALAAYQQALALKPDFPDAHNNLGNVYKDLRQFDLAIAAYQQALALEPSHFDAHSNLGAALKDQGHSTEAVAACRRALAIKPDHAEACNNLAAALLDLAQYDEAVAACRRALALQPDFAGASYNLGCALHKLGRLDEAQAAYTQALTLHPRYLEAYVNLGHVYRTRRQPQDAYACFHKALAINPDYVPALNSLAAALLAAALPDEALPHLHRALTVLSDSPPDALQRADLHHTLSSALRDQGRLDDALASARQAAALAPSNAIYGSNCLYTMLFHPDFSAADLYREHVRWNQQYAAPLANEIRPHPNRQSPNHTATPHDRRLRIGYVTPDLRGHVVGFNLQPLFNHPTRVEFELFAYADVQVPDAATEYFQARTDVWRKIVGLTDRQLADLIRSDQIDILVDCTLHASGSRLLTFARKPAPVQVTFFGYPGTTGLTAIDYRLTDPYLDPPVPPPGLFDQFYSEQSFRLPDTFWCYGPLTVEPLVNALPALVNNHVTFGCLNNFCKINDPILHLWARVINALPHSRLILLSPPGSHRQRILDILHAAGITPDRVQFVPYLPRPDYLRVYHSIDLCLDTLPYNGHTTSLDSYWMGVPVITLVGQTVVGRAGLSQLTNLGLTELIAHTPDQFVQIASDLAQDLPRLAQLRATLRQRMQNSPLMDAPRFAHVIESAYRTMWQRWCASSPTPL